MAKRVVFVCLALILVLAAGLLFAQETQIDLNGLIQETQKRSDKPGEMSFVWWIPQEYWQASFSQNPNMTAAQIDEFLGVFRPYTLVAVVDGSINLSGAVSYKSESDIRASLKLVDNKGNSYVPLADSEINVNTKSFLDAMKPMLANALGPIGQNMYFFIFPAQDDVGTIIADPKQEGAFSVKLGTRDFKWKLPLGSLLPAKVCPTCNEKISGNYKYCPWDGTKLE